MSSSPRSTSDHLPSSKDWTRSFGAEHAFWFRRSCCSNCASGSPIAPIAAATSRNLEIFLATPVETPVFDERDAIDAADVRLHLKSKGTPIGPYDVLIAAQARRRGAILVTANVREFRRVPRLSVEDWPKP
jgi:hypothetical protein